MNKKSPSSSHATTFDDYLERLNTDQRAALERLRGIVRALAPKAEECMSYHLPAFRLNGKVFVWFGASAKHCAIYGVGESSPGELREYDTSGKGTIRFTIEHPLPTALVRRLVKARIARLATRLATRPKGTSA